MNGKWKSFWSIVLVIILFILASWIVQTNLDYFQNFIGSGYWGLGVYFLIEVISIVVAPVTTIFLVPIVANIWGWQITAIISILAWTVGGLIAFLLARRWGTKLIKHLVSLEKIHKIEKKVPEENVFWTIVFLRMVIPMDILSYALGLFSKVKLKTYLVASIIGIIPFAIILSYIGTLPIIYQLIGWGLAGIAVLIGIWFVVRKKSLN